MSENNTPTSKKIVGIDLGTTNSVVAVLEGANPNVIRIQKVVELHLLLLLTHLQERRW